MPDELRFATEYHALASGYMVLSWVLSDFPTPEEELSDLIASMRACGMGPLFANAPSRRNPYA